jgi:hypothetical protein
MMMRIALRVVALAAMVALASAAPVLAQSGKTDVTGKWTFNVETGAGSGTPTMTLKQEGEKLTGHYSGQLGEADLAGTVKGTNVEIKFTVDVGGQQLNCIYTGAVDGKDSMKGKVDLVGLGEGTFTAKRQ